MPKETTESLGEFFKFRPWPPGDWATILATIVDPVINELDKSQRFGLARVGLELTRNVFEAHLKAINQIADVLKVAAGK